MAITVISDFEYRQPLQDSVVNNFGDMLKRNSKAFAKYAGIGFGAFQDFNPADGTIHVTHKKKIFVEILCNFLNILFNFSTN